MSDLLKRKITRRGLLGAGFVLVAGAAAAACSSGAPAAPTAAPAAAPKAPAPTQAAAAPAATSAPAAAGKAPTKVLDFQTNADVAKAEQEGQLAYYGHDGEAAIAALLNAFKKDFPKINTSYVRLQTGALYSKITAERSAGTYQCDVLQLSDVAPALDFQKKGGWEQYVSPEASAYKPEYLSNPVGSYFWGGVTFAGIGYNTKLVTAADAPKVWKDILDPKWTGAISMKQASSGMQVVEWYEMRKLYGNDFWKDFGKLKPKGFDSRAQLFDRLSKGDDKITGIAEYAGYALYKAKGADIGWVVPPDGLPTTPVSLGVVTKAPHPEAAKLFIDWAMSPRGQAVYTNDPLLVYPSLRNDAPPLANGKKLSDFKLLFPTDWADYTSQQPVFLKEWNTILGL